MPKRRRFAMPPDVEQRWWLRVEVEGHHGCWRWIGATWTRGYGRFTEPVTQRRISAHRWGYERFVGWVPPHLELDHRCRNHWCVRFDHLEPVSHAENVRRGIGGQVNGDRQRSVTHCPRGHEYTMANTYYRPSRPGRNCRACGAIVTRRRKADARERARPELSRTG